MGEVYQATDSKLGRRVAIKLLPAAFASDAERLSRFRREAQVLASLNHSNIAQIYGLEESGETRCIVMELVEGETLQARLQRGPVPVDEALAIAKHGSTGAGTGPKGICRPPVSRCMERARRDSSGVPVGRLFTRCG